MKPIQLVTDYEPGRGAALVLIRLLLDKGGEKLAAESILEELLVDMVVAA